MTSTTDLYPTQLQELCAALGWQGGTYHQVLAALKEQRAELTFDRFRRANVARCLKWHPEGIEGWSASDWLTAVMGELGELASLMKMRNRERDGLPGNKFSPTDKMVADELADVFTYLDLLAVALKVDLGLAAVSKFNEVSERVGFPDRIDLAVGQGQSDNGRVAAGSMATAAAADVLAERRRQVAAEGWTPAHDDEHDGGQLSAAAAAYAVAAADKLDPLSQGDGEYDKGNLPECWPNWDTAWWRPAEPRRMLVKAGALILAEIERLDRAAAAAQA